MASSRDKAACVAKIRAVRPKLEKIADELDAIDFNSNISSVVTSALSTLGSALAVAGGVATFLSFGAPALVVLAGTGLGTAAGIAGVVSTIYEHFTSSGKLDEANRLWEDLMKDPVFAEFIDYLDSSQCSKENGITVKVVATAKSVPATVEQAYEALKKARQNQSFWRKRVVLKGITKAGTIVEGVFLPFSIYDLVSSSIAVAKREKSHGGGQVRKLINVLRPIEEILAQ